MCALVPSTALLILDLGCSDGSLGEALKRSRAGCRVYGVEYSTNLAGAAQSRLDKVVVADLNRPDCLAAFSCDVFDCIVAADVLEHLVAPDRLLEKLHALMTEDARLVVSMPNIRHHSALLSIFVAGSFPRRERGIFDGTHLRWFTLNDARQLLKTAGFIVEAESYTLRVGDQGGGLVNRIVQRFLSPFAAFAPLREFMTYQFVLRARKCPMKGQ